MAARKLKPYEIGELDHYLFGQGTHYEIYKKLGAHKVKEGKKVGGRVFVLSKCLYSVRHSGLFEDVSPEISCWGGCIRICKVYQ